MEASKTNNQKTSGLNTPTSRRRGIRTPVGELKLPSESNIAGFSHHRSKSGLTPRSKPQAGDEPGNQPSIPTNCENKEVEVPPAQSDGWEPSLTTPNASLPAHLAATPPPLLPGQMQLQQLPTLQVHPFSPHGTPSPHRLESRVSFGLAAGAETHTAVSPGSPCQDTPDPPTETSRQLGLVSPPGNKEGVAEADKGRRSNPFKGAGLDLRGVNKTPSQLKMTPRWYVPGQSDSDGAEPNSNYASGRVTRGFEEDVRESKGNRTRSRGTKGHEMAHIDPSESRAAHRNTGKGFKSISAANMEGLGSRKSFQSTPGLVSANTQLDKTELQKVDNQDCLGGVSQKCNLI